MASGLRVWDKPTNRIIIDTSTAILMPFSTILVIGGDGAAVSGSYTDGNFARGTPEAILMQVAIGAGTTYKFVGQKPSLWFNGTTLNWQFPSSSMPNPPTCRILCGIS